MGDLEGIPDSIFDQHFQMRGNNARAWRGSAKTLWKSAETIEGSAVWLGDDMIVAERCVEAMLRGLAIECALKAKWLTIDPNNRLVNAELRFKNPPHAVNHNLVQLARAARLQLTPDEALVADRLSGFIKFAGRYPIPTNAPDARPRRSVNGRKTDPGFLFPSEFEIADAIWRKAIAD